MTVPRLRLLSLPVVMLGLGLLAPLVANCGGGVPGAPGVAAPAASLAGATLPTVCEQLGTGDFSTVPVSGGAAAETKVRTYLGAAFGVAQMANGVEGALISSCQLIGRAAALGDLDLKAEPDHGKGAERVCNTVALKVSRMLKHAREVDKVAITIEFDAPRCYVDVEATEKCLADCGSPAAGANIRASCQGGDIVGQCSGRCSGRCTIEGVPSAGYCHGVCTGKCDRDFRGVCGGKCNGLCEGKPTRGKHVCKGICDGSCDAKAEGICGNKCEGPCSGGWEPYDANRCSGTCGGTCSGGDVRHPLCSGDFLPPGMDGLCQASCSARALTSGGCDLPPIRITLRGGKPSAELEHLLQGLQYGLPRIVRIQQGASKKVPAVIEAVTRSAVEFTNAYATSGPQALLCVTTAGRLVKDAGAAMDVSIKATAPIFPALKSGEPPPPRPVAKPDDE